MLDAGFLVGALAGLTGGLHCLAMCGGYVAVAGTSGAQPLLPMATLRLRQAVTQSGRLATYLLLGAAVGAAGGAAFALHWPASERTLYALANVVLLLTAMRMLQPAIGQPVLERAGLAVFRHVAPLAGPWMRRAGLSGRFALGMLWGLTPCALIYGVLPVALLSGSAFAGAAVMLGLWMGTLPALLIAGRFAARLGTQRNRRAAAAVIAAFALVGLYRALFAPALSAAGPFCLTS
jgi:sulfite exporter TauE/SafE